ncbi:MAG TPA: hypothetical protein DIU07_06815 [Rhodobacteraceae bacterium]|nr:hypothetical protein [Paracoccaceae bacterium]
MKTPWHIWLIGVLSLLWNAGGAFDYVMAHYAADTYLAQATPEQRAYYDDFPVWATAFWALGVWGALAGSVLLLARSRFAALAFGVSLIGLMANTTRLFATAGAGAVDLLGKGNLIFTAALIVVALGLWLYARAMARTGVLR